MWRSSECQRHQESGCYKQESRIFFTKLEQESWDEEGVAGTAEDRKQNKIWPLGGKKSREAAER